MEYSMTKTMHYGIGIRGGNPNHSPLVKINGVTINMRDFKTEEDFREEARRINERTKVQMQSND